LPYPPRYDGQFRFIGTRVSPMSSFAASDSFTKIQLIENLLNRTRNRTVDYGFFLRPTEAIGDGSLDTITMTLNKSYLLVEPEFPIPTKSKNHKDFFPIGLLKLATMLDNQGNKVQIVRGNVSIEKLEISPDEVWVTSLFTYWSKYVKRSVEYYSTLFPPAKTVVGGIYASLMPEHCKEYTKCDSVFVGVHPDAEGIVPNYDLLPSSSNHVDFQVIHATRGCSRRCMFCGTWKIEPKFEAKGSLLPEIIKRKLVFYDNNLLCHPEIESILGELIELRRKRKILWCEAQSGFDGRVLLDKPHLGKMIRQAGFRSPRIAWDWAYDERKSIRKQLDILLRAGYSSKEIEVFFLYDWDIPFDEMEKKRIQCYRWGVQIADCRFRPLDQTLDEYNARIRGQTNAEYHIHRAAGWTDDLVKQYRMNVRRTNICVRHGFPFYSSKFERKQLSSDHAKRLKNLKTVAQKERYLKTNGIEYWFPGRVTYPKNEQTSLDSFI